MTDKSMTFEQRLSRQTAIIAPTGWREFEARSFFEFDFGTTKLLSAALILAPVAIGLLFLFFGSGALATHQDHYYRYLLLVAGFNLLAIAAWVTLTTLLTYALVFLLSRAGYSRIPLALRECVNTIGNWTTRGGVVGTMLAALTPIYWSLTDADVTDSQTISPAILWELPVSFGIVGYLFGLIKSILVIYTRSDNLVYRYGVPTVLFTAINLAFLTEGFGPEATLQHFASSWRTGNSTVCTNQNLEHLEYHPLKTFVVLANCNDYSILIPNFAYTISVTMIATGLAILLFNSDYRSRKRTIDEPDAARALD